MNNHYRKPSFHFARIVTFCFLYLFFSALLQPARAQTDEGVGSRWQRLKQIRETQRENRETVVNVKERRIQANETLASPSHQ